MMRARLRGVPRRPGEGLGRWLSCLALGASLGVGLQGCSTCASERAKPADGVANAGVGGGADGSGAAAPGGQVASVGGSEGGVPGALGGPVDLGAAVVNARQVGGLETSSGRRVRSGVLLRAGELSQVDCARLEALQIATVIDLRDAGDAAATPDATCARAERRYYLADLPKILPPSASSYLQTLDAAEPKLAAIFGEIARDGGLPAVIHCVIGRDRASLTMALVLLALGVDEDRVVSDFVENQATVGMTSAAWLSEVLARIEAAGGIDAYLASHGVTAATVEAIRRQALE